MQIPLSVIRLPKAWVINHLHSILFILQFIFINHPLFWNLRILCKFSFEKCPNFRDSCLWYVVISLQMNHFAFQDCALNMDSIDMFQTVLKNGQIIMTVKIYSCYTTENNTPRKLPANTKSNFENATKRSKKHKPKLIWKSAGTASIVVINLNSSS